MIQKIKSSTYLRKLTTIFSASLIGQALPFLFIPVLSRIYSPEQYSDFGVFMTFASAISLIGTLRFDQAILVPPKDDEAYSLAKSTILALLSISLLGGLFVAFYFDSFLKGVLTTGITFLIGYSGVFIQLSNRLNYNKTLGLHKISLGLSVSIAQFAFQLLKSGLIIGKMVGDLIAAFPFVIRFQKQLNSAKNLSIQHLWDNYKNFPLISLPHALFNLIGNKLPTLIFAYLGMQQLSGEYENVFRLGMAPLALISQALYLSFSSRVVELHKNNQSTSHFFRQNLRGLLITVVIPMIPAIIACYWLIPIFLGEEWENSGLFFVLLAPMLITTVITSPFVYIPQYLNKQKTAFILEISINILKISGLSIGLLFSASWGIFLFSLLGSLGHLIFLRYCYQLSLKMDNN